jgi:glutamyl-tRNA synthetase
MANRDGGQNILRIEDTDRTRYNPESEAEFISTLKWIGIEFHEGPHVGGPKAPYRQSERKEAGIYEPYWRQLLAVGKAYRAFETPQELDEMRQFQQINKMPTGYFGGEWRDASPEKVAEAEAAGKPSVIRLKIPRGEKIVIDDVVRGRLEWDSDTVDDPVLIKADGMPTYHFAAMVDDHLMEITHVLRGEEWVSSAPKHKVLFDAFGWTPPVWVHCPVIVGNDGKKLSKRHGATRVLDYGAMGILREPLKNFVALIGWAPGNDQEVMTQEELIHAFSIDRLQASPGRFDLDKLRWMNGVAIRALSPEDLWDTVSAYLADPWTKKYWSTPDPEPIPGAPDHAVVLAELETLQKAMTDQPDLARKALLLEQERVLTLAEFGAACSFFFGEEVKFEEKAVQKWFGEAHAGKMFSDFQAELSGRSEVSVEDCERMVKGWAELNGFEKLGPVVHPTRVALTGKTVGPGLFELMSALGPHEMSRRLSAAKELLRA